MPDKPSLTSSELGTLWLTYQQETMVLRMLEYFIKQADDKEAKTIMENLYNVVHSFSEKTAILFQEEGAAVPVGFTSQDVNTGVPKLYENGFDIMFFRLMTEIGMGMHTLNITMSSREDVVSLYKDLTAIIQKYYNECTQYLIRKGMLARPPYVSMPQSVEFVKDVKYLSGLNPFNDKRTLNTVEVAHIFHAIETNVTGMQMITGFAQSAHSTEVSKYCKRGMELSKSFITEFSAILLKDSVQAPTPAGGNVTRSTAAPFSDKLIMYCISLFCSFSLGGNSLGTAFSLRTDVAAKTTVSMKDVFEYAQEGAKIMIRNGWMEEPPQMEERKHIIDKN
ncbi:Protein of unknown function [Alteribacillus persepolensis]|uniref:DUF3231 family protein n=1 Tax=Alteribacillus persepolensis TaxID=568899 RepID=A0A1G7Y6T3_9BACI|nr:DUF3231 family protein [Alteribacillus persepolensis]SDG92185.1 Protein of unknown function [Alteribacillus persepolensis]